MELGPSTNHGSTFADDSKIDRIAIAVCRADVHLARICVASVRYWYNDIPIFLVKDGDFSTTEIEKGWNVTLLNSVPKSRVWGWGFSKFSVFFDETMTGRSLILDADIVVLGHVLEFLQKHPEDVLVHGEHYANPSGTDVSERYYDWPKLQELDPAFSYPGFCFNGGQLVTRGMRLNPCDFERVVEWQNRPVVRYPDIFKCGDQGVLNYIVAKKWQNQDLSLKAVDFMLWAGLPQVREIDLERIRARSGYPSLLHWAGPKPTSIGAMQRPDILRFYEGVYYSRVRYGRLKRIIRAAKKLALKVVWKGFPSIARWLGV